MITIILLLLFVSWTSKQKSKKIENEINDINDIDTRMNMLNDRLSSELTFIFSSLAALILMIISIFKT
jgi:hypothetical protein